MWALKEAGFTIVELLIVVVVIAILATITIVSFNGIQQRANASVISNSIDNWEKAIRMVAVEGAALPLGCLGESSDFPETSDFEEGVCVTTTDGSISMLYQPSEWTAWPSSVQKPKGILPTSQFQGDGFTLKGRGAWVFSRNIANKTITIAWVTQQKGACGRGMELNIGGENTQAFQGYCGLIIQY